MLRDVLACACALFALSACVGVQTPDRQPAPSLPVQCKFTTPPPVFDHDIAAGLSQSEVRDRWPEGRASCVDKQGQETAFRVWFDRAHCLAGWSPEECGLSGELPQ